MKNKFIGRNGPLLIAEIGGNHEGNYNYALKLTDLAINSGADVIKFQLYSGNGLVNKNILPDKYTHFKKFELTKKQHIEIAKKVKDAGLIYLASIWDINMLNWIDPYLDFYKIGSGDLTSYSILETFALNRKPIILSTGLSYEKEVLDAINFIQSINFSYRDPKNLALLQCTTMYPINYSDANLLAIKSLKEMTGLTVGYSDHTIGTKALLIAFTLGAQILEFHFTDQKDRNTFRDHKISLTIDDVGELIKEINEIKELLGDGIKRPLEIEIANNHIEIFRRAVFPLKNLKKGHVISKSDLTILRPNIGIDARRLKDLLGCKLKKDINKLQVLSEDLFN
jgi:N,N'-diacetyllegionaminate synthase